MSKLDDYAKKYAGIHTGKDPYKFKDSDELTYTTEKNRRLFDGSQLARKFTKYIGYTIQQKGRAITLLDYGCGQARQVSIPVKEFDDKTIFGYYDNMIQCYYCYDPGVPKFSMKPPLGMQFDLTCCADVLEHIPEEHIPVVLTEIKNYTKKNGAMLFSISSNLAKKTFVDGENLHITRQSIDWWLNIFKEYLGDDRAYIMYHTDDTRKGEGNDGNVWKRIHNSHHFKFKQEKGEYVEFV